MLTTHAEMRYGNLPIPDRSKLQPIEKDGALEEAIRNYKELCSKYNIILSLHVHTIERLCEMAEEYMYPILAPQQINMFLAAIAGYGTESTRGAAVNALMKKSYENGNTKFDFVIPPHCTIAEFGSMLKGTIQPYKIHVRGNLKSNSFYRSERVHAQVNGNVSSFTGEYGRELNLDFLGTVDSPAAAEAAFSTFHFHKGLKGHATHLFGKMVLVGRGASQCVFKVYDEQTFSNIPKTVMTLGYSNTLQLIGEHNEPLEERLI